MALLVVLILAYVFIPFATWQVKLFIVVILAVVGHSIGSSSQNKRFKEGEIKNDYDKKQEEEKQKVQQQSEPESGALNQDRLKPDPGVLDPSGKDDEQNHQYHQNMMTTQEKQSADFNDDFDIFAKSKALGVGSLMSAGHDDLNKMSVSKHVPRHKKPDYKKENEAYNGPVRSYILPRDSWNILDGPSLLKH